MAITAPMQREIDAAAKERNYLNVVAAWTRMNREATTIRVEGEGVHKVWRGFITHMYAELGFHTPYYTYTSRLLQEMDCALQVRQGHRNTASEWVIMNEPTPEAYLRVKDSIDQGRQQVSPTKMVQQQNRDLGERVSELEILVRHLYERVESLEGTS